MNHATYIRIPSLARALGRATAIRLLATVLAVWAFSGAEWKVVAEPPVLSESQVKALFLVNFAKYVDWPADAFATDTAPVVIGLVGRDDLGSNLEQATDGKMINGRRILVLHVAGPKEYKRCHILFISGSEKDRLKDILGEVKDSPVLTVGETDDFLSLAGMISFTKKANKIRLEINLAAAQQAHLKLSSKLLSVADVVTGKPESGKN